MPQDKSLKVSGQENIAPQNPHEEAAQAGHMTPTKRARDDSSDGDTSHESTASKRPHTRQSGPLPKGFDISKSPEPAKVNTSGGGLGYNQATPKGTKVRAKTVRVMFSPNRTNASSQDLDSPIETLGSPNASGVAKSLTSSGKTLFPREQSELFSFFSDVPADERESLSSLGPRTTVTQYFAATVTMEALQFMAGHKRKHGRRSPQQKYFFNNISAIDTAKLYGYGNDHHESWQYCHIIAHSLGGLKADSIVDSNGKRYENIRLEDSPQSRDNLFVGTKACNGKMIDIEKAIRELLDSAKVDRVEINIAIDFETQDGCEIPMATRLDYGLKCFKDGKKVYDNVHYLKPKIVGKPLGSHYNKLLENMHQHIDASDDRTSHQP